jgi:hypothetical protein
MHTSHSEFRSKLDELSPKHARAEIAKLTRNELYKASEDPMMWAYAATITGEAARRYFHGK